MDMENPRPWIIENCVIVEAKRYAFVLHSSGAPRRKDFWVYKTKEILLKGGYTRERDLHLEQQCPYRAL